MSKNVQPEGELFGRRLREVRLKKGLTQQQLSEIAGMSEAYISNLERGLKVPSLTSIVRLAVAFDCTVAHLLALFEKADLKAMLNR